MTDKQLATRVSTFGTSFWLQVAALAQKYDVTNLGLGFPNFEAPLHLRRAAAAAIVEHDLNQYTRAKGHMRLCRALAAFYESILGRSVDAEREVLITVGGAEALHSATQAFLNDGDEVLLFEPFFDFFYFQSLLAKAKPIGIPLISRDSSNDVFANANDWKIDFALMDKVVSKKCKMIILNTPSNPLGKRFSAEELLRIAHFAQKHNLIVIADEVYEHMIYDNQTQVRMAALAKAFENQAISEEDQQAIDYATNNTIQIGSAGKTFSVTGWKIGWLIAPASFVEAAWRSHQFNVYVCCTPLQEALAVGFEQKDVTRAYLDDLCAKLQEQRDKLLTCFKDIPQITAIRPSGAYFILLDISKVQDPGFTDEDRDGIATPDFVFCRWLARVVGVACVPVSPFFTAQHSKHGETFVRLCFAKKDETIESAIERLRKLKILLK